MSSSVIHAIVLIQNWGEDSEILKILKSNQNIISVFHIMGGQSYLLDANFDNKTQLSQWIGHMKSVKLSSGMPAIISMQTQKIIDVYKQKEDFSITDYMNMGEKSHFFVEIDNPHHDDNLIKILKESPIVYSILHVQGQNSFTVEVITDKYNKYRDLLTDLKKLNTIHHIETKEVISVIKYRNLVIDDRGNMIVPKEDIRELYTL
jgi:hypothetical protein